VKLTLPFRIALLTSFLDATVVGAQALHVPRIEVGGQVGWVGAIADCEPCVLPIVGPRLTINLSQQNALEVSAETLVPSNPATYGLYFLQYKRATRRPPHWTGIRPFYAAGTGGYYTYRKIRERRETRPDGSVVIYPAHSTGELSRLTIATFGGGFERAITRHASFRLEGSGFAVLDNDDDDGFLAYRVLAGISVPIGGYGAARINGRR
jgi:hypothetical protein